MPPYLSCLQLVVSSVRDDSITVAMSDRGIPGMRPSPCFKLPGRELGPLAKL